MSRYAERTRPQSAARASAHARARARGGGPRAMRKRFGQHFLEPAWVEKVVRAIDPKPDETFIEIGPGRGALTRPLAALTKSIVAYEIDRDLAADLRETAPPNVTIVEGDFLEANPEPRTPNPIRIAGNLPYNVASPILFRLVDLSRRGLPIVDATVMLQREVADRLAAESGADPSCGRVPAAAKGALGPRPSAFPSAEPRGPRRIGPRARRACGLHPASKNARQRPARSGWYPDTSPTGVGSGSDTSRRASDPGSRRP